MELLVIIFTCIIFTIFLGLAENNVITVYSTFLSLVITVLAAIFIIKFYTIASPVVESVEHLGRPAGIDFCFNHGKVTEQYRIENTESFYVTRTVKHRQYSAFTDVEYRFYKEFAENGAVPVIVIKTNRE